MDKLIRTYETIITTIVEELSKKDNWKDSCNCEVKTDFVSIPIEDKHCGKFCVSCGGMMN